MMIFLIVLFGGFAVFVTVIAWACSSAKRDIAQTLKTLGGLSCPKCGTAYGSDAATQAHEQFLARAHEAQRANPDLRINFGHTWTVRCTHCGAEAGFREDTWKLQTSAA